MLEQLVKEQNYKKIRAHNFKGLNLTSIKMTVQGELALLEAEIHQDDQESLLRQKYEEMSELMKIINEQTNVEVKNQAEKDLKMGAKLIQIGELEEWLLIKEHQK